MKNVTTSANCAGNLTAARKEPRTEECEASHARIRRTIVESYAGKYPCWIRVVFDDGLTRLYREVS